MEVRANLGFTWRGDKYNRHDLLPANEKQGKDLVAANLAYYDLGDEEQNKTATAQAKQHKEDCGCGGKQKNRPTQDNTISEIKSYLDKKGVEYTSSLRKSELLGLVK